MNHPPNHIFEHTPETLKDWCASHKMQPFRATQILEWVYSKKTADPAAMSNLSNLDRQTLAREMTFESGRVIRHQSATDGVQKLLIQWNDSPSALQPEGLAVHSRGWSESASDTPGSPNPSAHPEGVLVTSDPRERASLPILGQSETLDSSRQTECVMIPSEDPSGPRRTACISSQVGCPVGCRFCASGLGGLDANLSAGRIVEQVWKLGTLPEIDRITNVVFMGMGEPLANLASVVKAIRTISSLWALGISARKITISTVGLPKAIEKLAADLDLPVTLALSLHAPNDEVRRQLIPWAEYTTIADLLAACRKWFEKTGREITLEYTLLRGVNDRPEHAAELAQVARSLRANINLIRYNEVEGLEFKRPRDEDVREFQRLLKAKNINAHIRASRGRDIAAACGQLRHESAKA